MAVGSRNTWERMATREKNGHEPFDMWWFYYITIALPVHFFICEGFCMQQ